MLARSSKRGKFKYLSLPGASLLDTSNKPVQLQWLLLLQKVAKDANKGSPSGSAPENESKAAPLGQVQRANHDHVLLLGSDPSFIDMKTATEMSLEEPAEEGLV